MRDKVFISYTRADRYWREQVEIALKPKFRGTDAIWADVNLNPGAMWKQEIEQLLDRAKIAILLVTKEFCASEFINDVELPSILAAANRKELTVVWISVGHSDYKALGLDKFNCANDPKYPLKDVPEKVDAILVDIANFVYDRFHGLR